MASALGLKSKSNVQYRLNRLAASGRIVLAENDARNIAIPGERWFASGGRVGGSKHRRNTVGKKKGTHKAADQEINIWPPSKGAARQEVNVNPPGGRPPVHEARGTAHLVVFLMLFVFGLCALIIACGVASALNTGAIW